MAVSIDKNLCRGCGICVDSCPVGALTMDRIPIVNAEKCTECGECINTCPFRAIAVQSGAPVSNSPQHTESTGTFTGRGFGRGMGRGRGGGMGRGMGRGMGYGVQNPVPTEKTSQDSLENLHSQAETLKQQLEEIQDRINKLKSGSK